VAEFLGGAGGTSVAPSSVRVEVLNGAGVAGLARTTADRLAQQGFVIAAVADADAAQPQTSILVRPGARRSGEEVARALNVPGNRVSEAGSLPQADVRVVLGTDAR
jgi:hypothetical protein